MFVNGCLGGEYCVYSNLCEVLLLLVSMLMICSGEENKNYSVNILRGNELPKFQADGLMKKYVSVSVICVRDSLLFSSH